MSRKRKRLESFTENVRKRSKSDRAEPTVLTLREKLLIFALIIGVVFLVPGLRVRLALLEHKRVLVQRVERWKVVHGLTEAQADHLLEVEMEFHRCKGLFSPRESPSNGAAEDHRKLVNSLLGGDAASGGDHLSD